MFVVYECLFPSCVLLNNETLTSAQKYVQKCQPNMGNTDLWRPLHSLNILSDSDGGVMTDTSTLPPRSVFIISDGHITDEAPTLSTIKAGVKTSRIFTFGIR